MQHSFAVKPDGIGFAKIQRVFQAILSVIRGGSGVGRDAPYDLGYSISLYASPEKLYGSLQAIRTIPSFFIRLRSVLGCKPEDGTPAELLNPITYAASAWATIGLVSYVPRREP